MKALHKGGGNSIAVALGRSGDYISDSNKTNDGELIEGYECDPATAMSEFLFSKRQYEQFTGRSQGARDVIAYHIRMSFRPGEVTAEQALALGHELGLRFTKGYHQFIVAAHTNTANPHAHVIFNSTSLSCDRKFQDFKHSAIALRRISDQICLEHGLSIIEKPGLSKGRNYRDYTDGEKAPTVRERLCKLIDEAIASVCGGTIHGDDAATDIRFEDFLSALGTSGCEIKQGKHLAFKLSDGKKFIRCRSLGDDYSEDAIWERLSGKRVVAQKQKSIASVSASQKPNLLIDIQEKIQQGKGSGFEHWAKIFNLKESAKTLSFLSEHGLKDYDTLTEQSDNAKKRHNELSDRIKIIEKRLSEITELQKHIGAYSKTRDVYVRYRQSGYSKDFYNTHAADIILHQTAKKHFDSLGLKKLPSMQSLRQEYATVSAEKKKLYQEYHPAKKKMIELLTVKSNVDRILGAPSSQTKARENDREAV